MSKRNEETPAADEQQVESTTTEAPVVDETPEPKSIDDLVADPTPEELAASTEPVDTVEPSAGEASAPVDETMAPAADAGGVAAGTELDDDEPIEQPVKGEDGKWRHGKFVSDTLEGLFVELEKNRRNAEKLVGKKKEELTDDPFLLPDDGFDEFDVVDDQDFGQQVGAGVAQALAQMGFAPQSQQQDPALMHAQAVSIAQQAVDSPGTTDDEFRAVLAALISSNPMDEGSRQAVLNEWAERRPAAAAAEASQIAFAFAQHQQMQQQQQLQQQAMQQYELEQQQHMQVQQGADEFRHAQSTFVAQHPDWTQRNAPMNAWLEENAWLMEQAKQTPLVNPQNPQDRPRARAVYKVLQMAYNAAAPYAGAGVGGGVSEQGTNMSGVQDPNVNVDANARALAAEQRGMAGLETGAAINDVTISLTNPNPPGLADASFEDLVGIPTVKR